jgi:hypothetical protein
MLEPEGNTIQHLGIPISLVAILTRPTAEPLQLAKRQTVVCFTLFLKRHGHFLAFLLKMMVEPVAVAT